MDRQSVQPRRFLPLKDFVASVPASMSKVRRMIKRGRLEYAQPNGPGTDIYIPEDAFERLVVMPQLAGRSGEVSTEATSEAEDKHKNHPAPRSTWRKRLRAKSK
jgi:hypothetical protein